MTHTLPAGPPADSGFRLLCLRPVRPGDRAAMETFLAGLSDRSRRHRFLTVKHRFTDRELTGLTQVDQDNHAAWVAVDHAGGTERIVAESRYVRLADQPQLAEAALTVADSLQGRGLGRMLMAALAREARRGGVTALRGYVNADNGPMLRHLRTLGSRLAVDHPGVLRAEIPLGARETPAGA